MSCNALGGLKLTRHSNRTKRLPSFGPQALRVLDTYCVNVQRQGSGRIQNRAAYLMSLIQSYKLGPANGTSGSAQRLMERLSPPVSQAVQEVFDPVLDRVVLEDRALMELLAKVPEDQVRHSRCFLVRAKTASFRLGVFWRERSKASFRLVVRGFVLSQLIAVVVLTSDTG